MRWKMDRTTSRYSSGVQKIASSMYTKHDRELPSSPSFSRLGSRERKKSQLGGVELVEVLRIGVGFRDAFLSQEVDDRHEHLDISLLSLLSFRNVLREIHYKSERRSKRTERLAEIVAHSRRRCTGDQTEDGV